MYGDQNERLLAEDEEGSEKNDGFELPGQRKDRPYKRSVQAVCSLVFVASLILNCVLVGKLSILNLQQGLCRSEFTGLGHDKHVPYQLHTDYMHVDEKRNISDALWKQLDSNPVAISLGKKYITDHNLQSSEQCPHDDSKDLYQVKIFHHIHCLGNIRQAYFAALDGPQDAVPSIPPIHVAHCLDTLRQDIMCYGDDTPTPSGHQHHNSAKGAPRMCKDWGALVRWTQEPERQSCFRGSKDAHD